MFLVIFGCSTLLNTFKKIGIRIELYSYEDIYQLASDRNSVFFKLLRREFDLECDQI